jgi:hypothetical protein
MLVLKIKELIGRFNVCKPRIDRTKNVVMPVDINIPEMRLLSIIWGNGNAVKEAQLYDLV